MKKREALILKLMISALILLFTLISYSSACDIGVVSAAKSATGRPFIWKNRDHDMGWQQEIKYYKAKDAKVGGSLRIIDRTTLAEVSSGGVNESGFAICNTTVYEADPLHELFANANTDLLAKALERCITVSDFDNYLATWHTESENKTKVISGNFVVIDAHGGAALYEAYTGEGFSAYGAQIMVNKFDANTVAEGFVVRTNSHQWINLKGDNDREIRAYNLFLSLSQTNRLSYRNVLIEVAKDICGDKAKTDPTNVETSTCISRYMTNLAVVVDGVKNGDDPRLTTFWCNLGEPSVGVATPHFPSAQKISFFAWADNFYWEYIPRNFGPSCLLNQAINNMELTLYDNNIGTIIFDWDNILNSEVIDMDTTINYTQLLTVQKWTIPLENSVINKTEEYLNNLRQNPNFISADSLYKFSNYACEYTYRNYLAGSSNFYQWNYSEDDDSNDGDDWWMWWIKNQ
ncbi:MAG: hypothetical protein HQK76_17345 [Desulfobacterales bacterium]|nr:hypothetical protein [Desulfobacterales bacterium]